MEWQWFALRVSLADLEPRDPAAWQDWAVSFCKVVNFRVKGRWRSSLRAQGRLDLAHRQARELLTHGWQPAASAHGFVKGRSTRSAAARHAGAQVVLVVDLSDFYGQITWNRVSDELRRDFSEDVCSFIRGVCFVDDALPLGFRTSPILSNRAFWATDVLLEALSQQAGVVYTRWVDDLVFSGGGVSDAFLKDVRRVLAIQAWQVNERKVRFMRRSPYVLGLYVGKDSSSPRLPRRMKKRLLLESYHFSRRGFEHFSTPGVMSPDRLFGQMSYAGSIEPGLSGLLRERLEAGYALSEFRLRGSRATSGMAAAMSSEQIDALLAQVSRGSQDAAEFDE